MRVFLLFILDLSLAVLGLLAARGPSLAAEQGLLSSCGARASHCSGFSCCGAWALGTQASVAAAHGF